MKSYAGTFVLIFLSLTSPMIAGASTVSVSDLPNSIQSCVISGTCVAEQQSTYDSATASAFRIFQTVGAGVEQNWLMRYALVSPSAETQLDPAQSQSLGGQLWLLVKDRYDAAETVHAITLFLDKVSPVPSGFPGQNGDLSLQVSSSDLLAGGSYFDARLSNGNNYSSSGSLMGEVPPICLADNCGVHLDLNLAQLSYSANGSTIDLTGFNQADTRGLIFGQRIYFQSGDPFTAYDHEQKFYVSAVPLPASLWLLVPALLGMVGLTKRSPTA